MRDDSAKWDPALGLDRPAVSTDGIQITCLAPDRQTLISGPIAACLSMAAVNHALEWPDAEPGDAYALRLRRDRVLVVNGPLLEDGWHADEGVAVSDMTDGYVVIDLVGRDALSVLQRGTELSLSLPSASAVRSFAGHDVILFARGSEAYRLHISRDNLEALWGLLSTYAKQASEQRNAV